MCSEGSGQLFELSKYVQLGTNFAIIQSSILYALWLLFCRSRVYQSEYSKVIAYSNI